MGDERELCLMPYTGEMYADARSLPPVVFVCGRSTSKSEIPNKWTGHVDDFDPSQPFLMVQPTEEQAEKYSRERLDGVAGAK